MRKKTSNATKQRQSRATTLIPADEDQEFATSIENFYLQTKNSPNPKFAKDAAEFRAAFQEGDLIFEFCTSKASWRVGMGSAGYVIKRNNERIAKLVCLMN
jgi:hypothetical protein